MTIGAACGVGQELYAGFLQFKAHDHGEQTAD